MNLKTTCAVAIVALAGAAGTTIAAAQTTTTPAPTAPEGGRHWGHAHGGSMFLFTLLRATKQLNLTADQQANIKQILSTARAQHQAAAGQAIDMAVAGNPGDANYATAVQSAKSLAASRVQQESDLAVQIYNQLNTQQKQQLPQVLAAMKAKAAARRAAWQQQHAPTGTNTGN
jgi:hypothetical protein